MIFQRDHQLPIKWLTCTQEQFELLHAQLERARQTSTLAHVDRAALQALLIDHAKLIETVERNQ